MSSDAAAIERRRLAEVLLRDDVGAAAARIRVNRLAVREHDDAPGCAAMTNAIGLARLERAGAGEDQHAQDLLGRVGHRRQRVGREHGEAGDARQPLVMGEVRWDGLADDEIA